MMRKPRRSSHLHLPGAGTAPGCRLPGGLGYALITGLVGPIVNLLIGYFVATILNAEFGWNFKAMWLVFMLVPAALTAVLGYFGVKLGTWFGVALGAFEIIVFVLLSIGMLANAAPGGLTLSVFTLKYATAKGFTGAPGLLAGSVYVFLAFIGFEAAAPLAEEAQDPRRTVPRAVLLSCLIIGVLYLFTTLAAAAYVDPAHLQSYGGLGGGRPWILFARQLWGWGWVIVFLAVVNSFFANGNSALIASIRTWYAMGRIRLLPAQFERTHPRYESPVVGIAAQTILTLVIALPLALRSGPATAFQLLATILTAVMLCIYIVINISCVGYYTRKKPAEFNWFLHLVLPRRARSYCCPCSPRPLASGHRSEVRLTAAVPGQPGGSRRRIWFAIGIIYLAYLLRRHPGRVHDMDKVFD